MGHYIEDAFLNNAGDAQGNLPYDGLFSKIYYSPSYQAINKKAQAEDARSTYYEYLAGESETFARAFTQYVAIKSGDPALISQLQMGQKGTVPKFWSDDEFKPIMAEFDKMFIDLGWAIPT
jgi:hypothetical protein